MFKKETLFPLAGALLALLVSRDAHAAFSGSWAIGNWSESVTGNVASTWNISGAPSSVTLNNDTSSATSEDVMTITVPASGTITFDWVYHITNTSPLAAGYMINGSRTPLTSGGNHTQTGSGVSVSVTAGQTFGFYISANHLNQAYLTISNFSGPLAPSISVSPTSKDYGSVAPGSTTAQTFTITNSGGGNLNVSSISATGADAAQFTVTALGCANLTPTISGGSNCTIRVSFLASGSGAKSTTLRIVSNDAGSPTDVSLSATISGGAAVPTLSEWGLILLGLLFVGVILRAATIEVPGALG
ncbi:MAG: IPTL-CTERM sorting domain-containing protein [Myxococcota bacterium]